MYFSYILSTLYSFSRIFSFGGKCSNGQTSNSGIKSVSESKPDDLDRLCNLAPEYLESSCLFKHVSFVMTKLNKNFEIPYVCDNSFSLNKTSHSAKNQILYLECSLFLLQWQFRPS